MNKLLIPVILAFTTQAFTAENVDVRTKDNSEKLCTSIRECLGEDEYRALTDSRRDRATSQKKLVLWLAAMTLASKNRDTLKKRSLSASSLSDTTNPVIDKSKAIVSSGGSQ